MNYTKKKNNQTPDMMQPSVVEQEQPPFVVNQDQPPEMADQDQPPARPDGLPSTFDSLHRNPQHPLGKHFLSR